MIPVFLTAGPQTENSWGRAGLFSNLERTDYVIRKSFVRW